MVEILLGFIYFNNTFMKVFYSFYNITQLNLKTDMGIGRKGCPLPVGQLTGVADYQGRVEAPTSRQKFASPTFRRMEIVIT